MAIKTESITYSDQDTLLEGFLALPAALKAQKLPLVLLCHAWAGRNDFIMEKAVELAKLGIIGFALDMYGKGILGRSQEENRLLKAPFLEDRSLLLKRALCGFEKACSIDGVDTNRIACLGYGFGAVCALDLARSGTDIKGAISIYGHFLPPPNAPKRVLKAKILVLHGLDDPIAPMAELLEFEKEMKEANADLQVHLFSNTMHAFACPSGINYNPLSALRATKIATHFLEEIFRPA